MYNSKNQRNVDLQENSNLRDSKSWLVDEGSNNNDDDYSSLIRQINSISSSSGNLDPLLFKHINEILPLVESLLRDKVNSSFTRRGSIIYTKTPSRESLHKKTTDPKGRRSIPAKKKKEHGDRDRGKNGGNCQDSDNFSVFSSRSLASEKDVEEFVALREQVEDLQRKLAEKDEILKGAEISKHQMNDVHGKLDELIRQANEKDSIIKSTQQQLSDAKIKLADKQAALEKIQWEAMTSNTKVEKLHEELDSIQGDISSMMTLLEGLMKSDSTKSAEDYDFKPHYLDYLPDIDDMDEMDMQKMEAARQSYIAAVAAAKEKKDEESIAAAAKARLHLQCSVFKSNGINGSKDFSRSRAA